MATTFQGLITKPSISHPARCYPRGERRTQPLVSVLAQPWEKPHSTLGAFRAWQKKKKISYTAPSCPKAAQGRRWRDANAAVRRKGTSQQPPQSFRMTVRPAGELRNAICQQGDPRSPPRCFPWVGGGRHSAAPLRVGSLLHSWGRGRAILLNKPKQTNTNKQKKQLGK